VSATLLYSVEGGAYTETGPAFAADGSADGQHDVRVRARDLAGNITDGTSNTIFLDTRPPSAPTASLVNDTGVAGDGVTSDARFTFTKDFDATLLYSVDGGAYTETGPAFATDGSGDGQHEVRVRARDLAGNITDGTSNTIFLLDTRLPSPPRASLFNDTGLAGDGVTSDPRFTFTKDADATLLYSVDGGAYTETGTVFATDGSADGQHDVRVRARDLAGNITDGTSNTIFRPRHPATVSAQRFPRQRHGDGGRRRHERPSARLR
jgi:hypothetical protein